MSVASSTTHTAIAAGLDTARLLLQTVSRGFYDSRVCIVIDQLIRKEAFAVEELAGRVGLGTKDVSKVAQRLIEDQLISVHRRQELKEGAPKAQTRTYYYMDYSHATDVIKWRMYKIQETIDVKLRNELDSQGYICPKCRKGFTPLDASTIYDPMRNILACDVCDTVLIDNENEDEVRGSKDRMKRLVEQTKGIKDLLKKMDAVVLPKFDVIKWLELNGPAGGPATVASAETGPSGLVRIELAGDDDEALMKAKREADALEKQEQNQLPSWIAQSTISGEASSAQLRFESNKKVATTSTTSISLAHDSKSHLTSHLKPSTSADTYLLSGSPEAPDEVDLDSYYANLTAAASTSSSSLLVPLPTPAPTNPANVALPLSRIGSPTQVSPSPPSMNSLGKAKVKDEPLSDDEFEEVTNEIGAGIGLEDSVSSLGERSKGLSGKRSRDEVDSGWGEGGVEEEDEGAAGKRARFGVNGLPSPSVADERGEDGEAIVTAGDADEDDDEFEEEEEGGDPNPMIAVGDKMIPFLEVGEDLQAAMTPEEYTAYWDVYQRLG